MDSLQEQLDPAQTREQRIVAFLVEPRQVEASAEMLALAAKDDQPRPPHVGDSIGALNTAAQRLPYLRAVRRADQGEFAPLAEILARAVKESLDRFLLPNLAGPVKLMPLSALERPGLSVRGLPAAAMKGRLKTKRDDTGRWLSTGRWVDEYLSSRQIGRPKRPRQG